MKTTEEFTAWLDVLRQGNLPEGLDQETLAERLLAHLGTIGSIGDAAADALWLCAWHLRRQDGFPGALSDRLAAALDETARPCLDAPGETRRGRATWIMVNVLMQRQAYDRVEALLLRLVERETAAPVWDRALNALGDWFESYRFFPRPLAQASTRLEQTNQAAWDSFKGKLARQVRLASELYAWHEKSIPGSLASGNEAELNGTETILRQMGRSGASLPFPLSRALADFASLPQARRHALLKVAAGYFSEASAIAPPAVRESLADMVRLISRVPVAGRSWYEASWLTAAKCWLNLDGPAEEQADSADEIFALLERWGAELGAHAELAECAASTYGPLLSRLAAGGGFVERHSGALTALLANPDPFLVNLAARVVHALASVGQPFDTAAVRAALAKLPMPKKDFQAPGHGGKLVLPSLVSWNSAQGLQSDDAGFMNLRGMTAMLGAFQGEESAWYLSRALGSVERQGAAAPKGDPGLAGVLGPLTLPQIIMVMEEWQGLDWKRDRDAIMESAARRQKHLVAAGSLDESERQRALVRAAFTDPLALSIDDGYSATYRSISQWRETDGTEKPWPGPFCSHGPEGSPDWLALYLGSGTEPEFMSGVYFQAWRLLDFADRHGIELSALLRAVAVHELFHGFMDLRIPLFKHVPQEGLHRHPADAPDWCRLEEAAANKVASVWARELPAEQQAKLHASLLPTLKNGGTLPGYAEHHLLSEDCASFVPEMLVAAASHATPTEFGPERLALAADGAHAASMRQSAALWKGMLATMDDASMPWYLDLRCKK